MWQIGKLKQQELKLDNEQKKAWESFENARLAAEAAEQTAELFMRDMIPFRAHLKQSLM